MMKSLAAFLTASLFAAAATAAGPAAPAAAVDLAKGKASYEAICAACHGQTGTSSVPNQPNLAQQFPQYTLKQLRDYKSGARAEAIMAGMVTTITDEDMVNIAAWLATQKAEPGHASDPELVFLGERIYRGGLADRHIPACAGCHSPNGAGIPSQYPRLSGQHAAYTETQLKGFRDGTRGNNAVMTGVAAKMNDREIRAVADYIAGLR